MSVLVAILLNLKFLDLHYCLEFMETCIGMLVGVGVSMTIISVNKTMNINQTNFTNPSLF